MERIREPELMDDPLQARVYAEADFASSDQAFTNRILALLADPGRALAERGRRRDHLAQDQTQT